MTLIWELEQLTFRPLVLLVLVNVLDLSSCGFLPVAGEIKSKSNSVPIITDISPPSGPAGVAYPIQVTIRGREFMLTGNTVTFGPMQIPNQPSPDGRSITLFVPKEVPSRSEVPPMVLSAGEYSVTITTPAGTSQPFRFTLTGGSR